MAKKANEAREPRENEVFAIWEVVPGLYNGEEVDSLYDNKRAALKAPTKEKPIIYYHSLYSLAEGKDIMMKIGVLQEEYRQKRTELARDTMRQIKELVNKIEATV